MSPAEYLPARLRLLEKEKELIRARDALTKERQALPIIKVGKCYEFTDIDTNGNKVTKHLDDLFDGREQLIIYHFMFDPEWEAGCPSCTLLAETMSGLEHLNSRGVTLTCVSRAPIEKIQAYKKRLGFTFPWVSSFGNTFNQDFHVTLMEDDPNAQYNFYSREKLLEKNMPWFTKGEQPGHSCFIMGNSKEGIGEDGVVYHTYSSYSRAGEAVMAIENWLDMTKLGRRDDINRVGGVGFRRRDEYSNDELKGIWA